MVYEVVNLYREKKRSKQNTPGKLPKNEDANLEDYKRTLISFNNGGSWRPLSPPSFDASGRPLSCVGCSLHLFIDSTHLIQGAVAPKTALGLIVAHGNVGNSLSHVNIGVYVSSDGGISWNHARDGLHRMALGNHGGIVLLADASKPTRTLLYSYDHGKKFDSVTFSPEGQEVTVTSLKSDHSNPGSIKFFLSGLKHTQNGVKGVALIIDLSHNNLPECRLIEKPGTKHSDYEYFEIRPTNSSECTLGSKNTYVKKRPTANCRVNNSDGFIAL